MIMPRTFAYVGCRTTRERKAEGTGIGVYAVYASGAWQHVQTLEPLVNPSSSRSIARRARFTPSTAMAAPSAHIGSIQCRDGYPR